MNITEKNLDGRWYIQGQLDFDRKLIYYRYQTIKNHIKGPYGLELGSAEGEMTQYLINDFEHLISVDGSKELLDMIPLYPNHTKIHSFFEDFKPNKKFNTIIMEHILEHVDQPVDIMLLAKEWLEDDGIILLGVPNALSIHRLVAVKMGLLQSPDELNSRDHALGHQRVYCMKTFLRDIKNAGLKVLEKGGVFFKPLSNGQIEQNWDENMIEGFYQLGKDFPDNAAEIYVVCQK
ncbi:class I SAM-dependent methyltransferase [Sulfurospirillum sp.]|uniref:class I SAM-dependent methyltransferase n=1 Tax=Sulfurospirillum sp. TaxID=2053622 RepID=UPI002FDD564E